jgi:hypothetical protein
MAVVLNIALIAVLIFAWMLQRKQNISLEVAVVATTGVLVAGLMELILTHKRPFVITLSILVLVALALGSLEYRGLFPPSHLQLVFGVRCIVSTLVIALSGMLPFRTLVGRIVTACMAGVVLLLLIWK